MRGYQKKKLKATIASRGSLETTRKKVGFVRSVEIAGAIPFSLTRPNRRGQGAWGLEWEGLSIKSDRSGISVNRCQKFAANFHQIR